jgi:hypothetical protein
MDQRVTGHVDGVVAGELSGWALDPAAPDSPVVVDVLVDGRTAASSLAAWHRPDVGAARGTRGYHGFHVDLRRCAGSAARVRIEVRTSKGDALGGSPVEAPVPSLPGPDAPALVYMHIPKTAGCAFREALEGAFPRSNRFYAYRHDNFVAGDLSIWQLPRDQRNHLRFVAGHFPFGIHEALPCAVDYFTIVRRPFDRVRSNYLHYVRTTPQVVSAGGELRTLADLLERPPLPAFDNLMVRYFSGLGHRVDTYPPGTVDSDLFELAVRNMKRWFGLVGVQEHADGALGAMRERYGLAFTPSLPRSNVGHLALTTHEERAARDAAAERERWDERLVEEVARHYGPPQAPDRLPAGLHVGA